MTSGLACRPGTTLLTWAALVLLVFGGRMYTTDVVAQYEAAGSLVGERPLLTVSGDYGWVVSGVRSGPFVPHAPGYSVLLAPASLAGRVAGTEAGKVVTAITSAAMSLLLLAAWHCVASLRYGRPDPLRMAALAVGGMALVYARMPYDVTSAAALAMTALLASDLERPALAGALMGMAVLVRVDSVLLLPVLWRGWRPALRTLAGMLPFLLLLGAANAWRFGSPFADGHGQDPAAALRPLRGGVAGLLLSPGKGLLWYAPLCLLAALRHRAGTWRLWMPFLLSLLLHGSMHDWTGGTGWGPRFLFTALPFLLLPLARRGAGGRAFWALAGLTLVTSLAASWTDVCALERSLGPDLFGEPGRQAVVWTFSRSPLTAALGRLGTGTPDLLGASAAAKAGLPPWAGAAGQAAAALGLLTLALRRRSREAVGR